jgi:hypothetical protein
MKSRTSESSSLVVEASHAEPVRPITNSVATGNAGGFRLVAGESYLWLFPYFCLLSIGGFALSYAYGDANWGIITVPCLVAFLSVWELRSKVALDWEWRAQYQKGSWQFIAVLTFRVIAVILLSIFAHLFIR